MTPKSRILIPPNGNELHLTVTEPASLFLILKGKEELKRSVLNQKEKQGCAFFPGGITICNCFASSVVNFPFSAFPAKAQKRRTQELPLNQGFCSSPVDGNLGSHCPALRDLRGNRTVDACPIFSLAVHQSLGECAKFGAREATGAASRYQALSCSVTGSHRLDAGQWRGHRGVSLPPLTVVYHVSFRMRSFCLLLEDWKILGNDLRFSL